MICENDYYVYLHKRKDNGQVFYVGKGRNGRAYQNSNRSKDWNSIVRLYGYDVALYETGLSEDDALDLEAELIDNPEENWRLVNKQSRVNFRIPNINLLRQSLKYDPNSPSGLVWLKTNSNRVKNGDNAGYLSPLNGYGW